MLHPLIMQGFWVRRWAAELHDGVAVVLVEGGFSGGPEGSAHYFGFFGLICAAMRRRHAKCAARDWVRPGLPGPSSRVLTADLGG